MWGVHILEPKWPTEYMVQTDSKLLTTQVPCFDLKTEQEDPMLIPKGNNSGASLRIAHKLPVFKGSRGDFPLKR